MKEFKKEDTNPDIELLLEEITKAEQGSSSSARSVIDLSSIDPNKPLPGAKDRRTHPRLEMKGSIHLHAPSHKNVSGTTADISASGVGICIEDRFEFAAGAVLTIEFRPPSGLNGFLAQVEVIRSTVSADGKKRLGLKIVKCTTLMQQKLVEFIKKAA